MKRPPNPPIGVAVCNHSGVKGSVKSAESDRKWTNPYESCPEVDGVTYMPGFYKISTVRMLLGGN